MKRQTKIISLLLSLLMLLSVFTAVPLMVNAAEAEIAETAASGTTGDCTWELNGTVLTISGNGYMENYTCPDYGPWDMDLTEVILKDGVKNIGECAFFGCENLTNVTIPSSVTSIGYEAFYFCSSLEAIDIPDAVTSIGDEAFYFCDSLKSVTIPCSVTSIGNSTFAYCAGLTSVTIPDSITSIGSSAFYNCDSLTDIDIPDSVTGIGSEAFYSCDSLKNVTLPASVTQIGDGAFSACGGLLDIEVAKDNQNYISVDGVLFNKEMTELISYPAGKTASSYQIPETVTRIGAVAFAYSENLADIDIPDSVTHVGHGAFYETLWYERQPDGLVYAGKVAYTMKGDCPSEVSIKDGTTMIGDNAFVFCDSVTSVTIPDSVTYIGVSAFGSCTGLTDVTIPDSVTYVGWGGFSDCENLAGIEIGSGVTSIGEYAFYNTAWFNSQPDGLVYAGKVAYKMKGDCPSEVTIKDGTAGITDLAFYYCDNLKKVTIPGSVAIIGNNAFDSCSSLKNVTIGSGVTTIGEAAFYECPSLEKVTIPASVTQIGDYAFAYGCFGRDYKDYFVLYGNPDTAAETYAIDNNITFVALDDDPQPTGYTVSGTVTSFLSDSEDITVTLPNGEVSKAVTVSGNSASYSFADIPAGSYTLSVEKKDHATCTYAITVSAATEQDVKLHPLGDINGDGKITNMDFSRANSHARGMTLLTGYELTCADVVKGDGVVTNMDASRINSAARGVAPLW